MCGQKKTLAIIIFL